MAETRIPGILVEFLEERASAAFASTRDREMRPRVHWISGWKVDDDHGTITCLVSEPFTAALLDTVADNGQVALTVEQIGPHETYQFKGSFLDSRPLEEADRETHRRCRARFVDAVLRLEDRFEFTAEQLARYFLDPALAVSFRVREIFLQTPGPGAGRRLAPPER